MNSFLDPRHPKVIEFLRFLGVRTTVNDVRVSVDYRQGTVEVNEERVVQSDKSGEPVHDVPIPRTHDYPGLVFAERFERGLRRLYISLNGDETTIEKSQVLRLLDECTVPGSASTVVENNEWATTSLTRQRESSESNKQQENSESTNESGSS